MMSVMSMSLKQRAQHRMRGRQIGRLIILAIAWLAPGGEPAWASEAAESRESPSRWSSVLPAAVKLGRGTANLTTGWAEFPKQIYVVGRNEGWAGVAFRGVIDGLGMTVARTLAGAYEIISFPFPIPPRYQPLMQPALVWQPDPESRPRQEQETLP
jgi:putative exosortase-associated protein (TIGR04073 family)